MQPISREILERFQVRCRWQQKTRFIEWLVPQLQQAGYSVNIEESRGLAHSRNIIVGNIARAKYIFGAHYDTPARLPFPNFLAPKNLIVTAMFQLLILMGALAIALPVGLLVSWLTHSAAAASLSMSLIFALFFFLLLVGVPNPATANDNTSGVITLIECAFTMPQNARDQVAYVFFDNEEKGMVGSGAFNSRHKSVLKNTTVINFDCVSDGDDLYVAPKGAAKKDKAFLILLANAFKSSAGKRVHIEKGMFLYPSDQSVFRHAAAVCALRSSRLIGPHVRRIHTARDTAFDERNIELLRRGMLLLAGVESK